MQCDLRYPLVGEHPIGERCPNCFSETSLVLGAELTHENPTENLVKPDIPFHVLLDNIRSAWNVGAILRCADGLGLEHAYLCGITPPADQPAVKKTSLGAESSVAWSHHKNSLTLINRLKDQGFYILALEFAPNSAPIEQWQPIKTEKRPIVLVLGNEITGIDSQILEACHDAVHINMLGEKRSLNVAVAFAIAAFQLMKENLH